MLSSGQVFRARNKPWDLQMFFVTCGDVLYHVSGLN